MNIKWESTIEKGLNMLENKGEIAMDMFSDTASKKFQAHAQENRPWTDRTGEARRRLKGYYQRTAHGRNIFIAHGVWYGVFLENAHEMMYAILGPTITHLSAEVMKGWERLMERIGG